MRGAPVAYGAITLALLAAGACAPAQNGSPGDGAAAAVSGDSRITMQRLPCYGTCPVYRVTIAADGTVTFDGERHVAASGTHTATVAAADAAALMRELDAAGFFGLEEKYVYPAQACGSYHTDAPRVLLTLVLDGRSRTVEHDHGCGGAPALLRTLQDRVDEVAGTARWIGASR